VIELRRLHQVIVLMETRNYVKAAEILKISQPSLSRSIQQLEQQFGVLLFHRTSRQLVPTDICQLIAARGRLILRDSDQLYRMVQGKSDIEAKSISLGTGMYAKCALVPAIISRFTAAHPDIRLNLTSSRWQDGREQLRQGDIDVYIGEATGDPHDPLYAYRYLRRRQGYIVVRRGHPLTSVAGLTFDDVEQYPLAGAKIPPRLFRHFRAVTGLGDMNAQGTIFDPHFESHLWEDIVELVANTDAVTFGAPAIIAGYEDRLVCLDLMLPWLHNHGAVIWRRDPAPSPEASMFIELILELDGNL
jgi:DNA-binding transcriptional LysR family regulator